MSSVVQPHIGSNQRKRIQLTIRGTVQGIGFRPFIYKTATKYGITGWVENRSDSVWIKAQGTSENIETFVSTIKNDSPVLAKIESIKTCLAEKENNITFDPNESKVCAF